MSDYFALDRKQALTELRTQDTGLKTAEAESRLGKYGQNQLTSKKGTTKLKILAEQFKDFLILLLIGAALVSIILGISEGSIEEIVEAALILVIVVFIVIVGFYQQYHAEKELDALKSMMSPHARVLRDGQVRDIDASELVVGDIVMIEAGDRIPADLRILEAAELRADESSLTGESTPVDKVLGKLPVKTALADRKNMLYMATTAVYGRAKAVVVATGMQTQLGQIAENISEIKDARTPLQARLNKLGKQIGAGVVVLCTLILLVGMFVHGTPFQEMLLVAIALAVAAVPEGLPGVVTIALASGIRKMVSENVIIRKLPAVETLGSTTIICSDKTGTLTKNEMTVRKIWTPDSLYAVEGDGYGFEGSFKQGDKDVKADNLKEILTCGALVCDATVDNASNITGDPTEAAVVVAAAKGGIFADKLRKGYTFVDEIPFSSERKKKTKIYEVMGGHVAYSMGAPDVLLESCAKSLVGGKEKELTQKDKEDILKANEDLANQAFRVLALAKKQTKGKEGAESGMTLLGLVAMIDPPRQESKEAVAECKSAGIRVVMITGDHKLTARAIAEELGIYHKGDEVLTGPELEEMSDAELKKHVDKVSIYARVSPIHKLRIVEALQAKGNVVAMTGDGVNDAPALKKADIGIAMGITGTDVSKEAADMVLTDDNFSSIVKAVKEGRGIYDNIRKFFAYLISGNIGEVAVVFLSAFIPGAPIALSASQILIINLVTDGLPALALGVDPFEPGAMKRKPRPKSEPLHHGLRPFIVWYPLLMIIVTMGLFLLVWDPIKQNVFEAQTVAFLSIAFFEMYQAFASRSTRYPAFKVGILKNKYLLAAVGFSLVFLLILVYVPIGLTAEISLQELTHVVSIEPMMFVIIALVSALGFVYLELSKWRSTQYEGPTLSCL